MPAKTVDLYKRDGGYYCKAIPGTLTECPGTMENKELNDKGKKRVVGSAPCGRFCQVKAVTDPSKPSAGRLFISCDADNGGCGYFAFAKTVVVDDVPQVVAWSENFWEANKRKRPTPVPTEPIDPVGSEKCALDELRDRISKLEKIVFELEQKFLQRLLNENAAQDNESELLQTLPGTVDTENNTQESST